jgi:hypothetical protein
LSSSIDIERRVKYGDALSCATYILCADPLITNKNAYLAIRREGIKSRLSRIKLNSKAGAFADDVDVVCKSNQTI